MLSHIYKPVHSNTDFRLYLQTRQKQRLTGLAQQAFNCIFLSRQNGNTESTQTETQRLESTSHRSESYISSHTSHMETLDSRQTFSQMLSISLITLLVSFP